MKKKYFRLVTCGVLVGLAPLAWADQPAPSATNVENLKPESTAMNLDRLKLAAFARCQGPFAVPVILPVPELDPPRDGSPDSVGMIFQKELAVRTKNLLEQNGFYFSPRPRAGVNTLAMDIAVDADGTGNYISKSWADAAADYTAPEIKPAIDKDLLPAAGRVLTELILGHQSPKGDWPQLFDLRSSAYVRFAGYPPQVTGASMRLGAHRLFGKGGPGQVSGGEDFPILRALYVSTLSTDTARAYAIVENKLFCGALVMDMSPTGNNAAITVDSYLYAREDFQWQKDPHTGLVAYSSMFLRGQPAHGPSQNNSAHDSDTMTVGFTDGTQTRLPIHPPADGIAIHDLAGGKTVKRWVLSNEDRNPAHYAYFLPALGGSNYNLRASYDVTILESNVKTGVALYEQATNVEYGDNIVAISTLRQNVKKAVAVDQFVHFKYKTTAFLPKAP